MISDWTVESEDQTPTGPYTELEADRLRVDYGRIHETEPVPVNLAKE